MKEIKIDLNKEDFLALSNRLEKGGGDLSEIIVVMDHAQFRTFKLIYTQRIISIDNNGFQKQEIIEPTTMGSVYGLSYRVEN